MSARDRRLAAEMARKHGSSFESATDRANRKSAKAPDREGQSSMQSSADWVAQTPQSAKRRVKHRENLTASARKGQEPAGTRSITKWFRSW